MLDPHTHPLDTAEPTPAPGVSDETSSRADEQHEHLPQHSLRATVLTRISHDVGLPGLLPAYHLGRQYASCVTQAFDAGELRPVDVLAVGDRFLGPLGNINDPELLRDFIAGVAKGFETSVQDNHNQRTPIRDH